MRTIGTCHLEFVTAEGETEVIDLEVECLPSIVSLAVILDLSQDKLLKVNSIVQANISELTQGVPFRLRSPSATLRSFTFRLGQP